MEYINGMVNPLLTWGATAYTQYGNLPLMQIVSVTGIWGLSFLVTWCAPVVNWAWENNFEWPRIRRGVITFASVLLVVLMFGGIRILNTPSSETVRVASIISKPEFEELLPDSEVAFDDPARRDDYFSIMGYFEEKTREEARAGADIVVWQEYGFYTFKEDEALVIERGQQLAQEEGIHLSMGIVTEIPEQRGQLVENKTIWISPSGDVIQEYLKSKPVPGSPDMAGPGIIPVEATEYGQMSTAICYDLDQPTLIRQAGRQNADMMLIPAYDFGMVTMHTPMVSFRAIENGFSAVRATGMGVMTAYDYHGRVLATADYLTSPEGVTVAQLPTKGVRTIYSMIGDAFAWGSALALAILIVVAYR